MKTISLSQAVSLGLTNSPSVQSAISGRSESKALYRQYLGELFPTIDLNASSVRQTDSVTSGLSSSTTTDRELYKTTLSLTQPLYKGGAIGAGLRLGQLGEETSEQNYYKAKQERVEELVKNYYDLAEQEARLEAILENQKITESYLGITRRYQKIGRARRMDRLQAEANFNMISLDREDAENQTYLNREKLMENLALPSDVTPKLQTNFQVQPITSISFESALEQTLKNSPEYLIKKLNLETLRSQNDLDLSTDLPSLELRGELGYYSSDRSRLFDDTSEYNLFGVYLTVPVFSGLTSISKRKVHRENIFQSEKDLVEFERTVRVNLKDNLKRVKNLYDLVLIAEKASEQTAEALKEANQGYSRGTATSQDVISFQKSRFDAQQRLIQTKFNYLRGLLSLRKTLGIDLEKTYAEN